MTYSDAFNLRTTSVKFNDVASAIDGALTRIYVPTTTGTSTAYAASPTPAWQNYTDAPILIVIPHVTNTAGSPSVTINVSGLGAKVVKRGGADISAAAFVQGVPSMLVFNSSGDYFEVLILENALRQDGTNAMLANLDFGGYRGTNVGAATARTDAPQVAQVQDGDFIWLGTAGGTATALTASATPDITAYKAGQKFRLITASGSTGATPTAHTLAIDGVTPAKNIVNNIDSTNPTAGTWLSGVLMELVYDGTNFRITNDPGGYASWTPTVTPSAGSATGVVLISCFYRKIGKTVILSGTIAWTQNTTGAGGCTITGLPVQSDNGLEPAHGFVNGALQAWGHVWTATSIVWTRYDSAAVCFPVGGVSLRMQAIYRSV